jgi:hypothetical protein
VVVKVADGQSTIPDNISMHFLHNHWMMVKWEGGKVIYKQALMTRKGDREGLESTPKTPSQEATGSQSR